LRNSATTSTLAGDRTAGTSSARTGSAGVDDVLDDHHVPAGDVAVQVLEDAHHADEVVPCP
jgi:hypothetical protein